jgi:hypothetical protein
MRLQMLDESYTGSLFAENAAQLYAPPCISRYTTYLLRFGLGTQRFPANLTAEARGLPKSATV